MSYILQMERIIIGEDHIKIWNGNMFLPAVSVQYTGLFSRYGTGTA
jgi:hypothetical protein